MKIRLLELFGGIGACTKAISRLGIEYEIIDYVEIDKHAVASYNAMHDTNFEPQDICTWNKNIVVDLVMHGSPCQDFSLAGKQAGGDKDSGTRSSLMYETIRIVEKLKPKYVIWENVKNVISKKHIHNFNNYITRMNELGYTSYYQVLNAKDYGIPQNRERVFVISILGEHKPYTFPPKQELKLSLKDMLEDEVDEKYYLSEKMMNCFMSDGTGNYSRRERFLQNINRNNQDIRNTITTRAGSRPTDNFVVCKTLNDELMVGLFDHTSSDNFAKGKRDYGYRKEYGTLKCIPKYSIYKNTDLRIRKLTPKECWRLMGFDDEDFEKASKVNSNTQLYKQAGNSIVVNVLEEILKKLLKEEKE